MDIRRHKPLWGFGPIGWTALAILTAFVTALLRGWDLVHACAVLIWRFSRDDIGNWVRIWVVVWCFPAMAMAGPTFGVWGLLYSSIAFFVYPRHLPRTAIVLLFFTVAVEAFTSGLWSRPVPSSLQHILSAGAALIEAGLILWITRRWWCAAPFAIPFLLFTFVDPSPVTAALPHWLGEQRLQVSVHTAIGGPLLAWAIAARLKPAPTGKPCPSCDYDLTGLAESALCPECGKSAATT